MTSDVNELHTTTITTPSDTEVRIERVVDAPRELVWEAYTDPELLAEWLGPRSQKMTVETMDVRPGGAYRYSSRGPDGKEHRFHGEFREVEAPKLLVATFEYEGTPGETSLDRTELEEVEGGRTRIVATSSFDSKQARDAMLKSGMEVGVREGYEKLDELLARRRSER